MARYWRTVLFFVAFFCIAKESYCSASKCQLPTEAALAATHAFPNWRQVALNDLNVSQRKQWTLASGSGCPGIIEAHFAATNEPSLAFALLSPAPQHQEVVLLYVPDEKRLITVVPAARMRLQVHYLVEPGDFTFDGGPTTHWDSVGVGPPEGLAYLKYWDGKKFITVEQGD